MRSSTSASDRLSARIAIALLLGALALYFCVLEVAMRYVVPTLSAEQLRRRNDYHSALALRSTTLGGAPTILLVGNSLLLDGVVRSELRQELAPAYAVSLFPIEGTTYLDWYFGLRRFFSEGSHPGTVILCINVGALASDATADGEFAHFMMRRGDLLRVKSAAGLGMMPTSDYFFASLSGWLGMRAAFRNALLEKWLPNAPALVAHFAQANAASGGETATLMKRALERLRNLQELCRAHGVNFVMLIPPTLNASDPGTAVAAAAAKEGIPVLVPYPPAAMPATAFSDGFHLASQGAVQFTHRLAQMLPPLLANDGKGT